MNTTYAKNLFLELNREYLNGVLPIPRIVKMSGNCSDNGFSVWGSYDNGTIYYHRKCSKSDLRATMAHEMCHYFQDYAGFWYGLENDNTPGDANIWHGQDFYQIGALFRKGGITI